MYIFFLILLHYGLSLGIEYSLFLNTRNKKNLDQLGAFGAEIRGQQMYLQLWRKKIYPHLMLANTTTLKAR